MTGSLHHTPGLVHLQDMILMLPDTVQVFKRHLPDSFEKLDGSCLILPSGLELHIG